MGYHTRQITKGVLGHSSKIREELEELEDAELQGNRILAMCELADIYGALAYAAEMYGLTMTDLEKMALATSSAFKEGSRQ